MAIWYVNDASYAALSPWQPSTSYSTGSLVKQATGADNTNKCVFEATTGGTSGTTEPTWNASNNGTVTDGSTLVWTNVTGQTKAAAAGTLCTLTCGYYNPPSRLATCDTVFIANTYNETGANVNLFAGFAGRSVSLISAAFSGSTPPAAADYTPGASISFSGRTSLYGGCSILGVSFSSSTNLFAGNTPGFVKFRDALLTCGASSSIFLDNGGYIGLDLEEVTLNVGSGSPYAFDTESNNPVRWQNKTAAAFTGGNYPTYIFQFNNQNSSIVLLDGLDISGFNGTALFNQAGCGESPVQVNNCVLPASFVWLNTSALPNNYPSLKLEFSNCTNANNNYMNGYVDSAYGTVDTDASTYLSGGSETPDGTAFSHKLTRYACSYPTTLDNVPGLAGFDLISEVNTPGTALTATVQCVCSDSTINAGDIMLEVTYPGSSSNCKSSVVRSRSPLQTSALPNGSGTWASPPATPYYFSLQATFTPEAKGVAVGRVILTKPSAVVWHDGVMQGVS